MWMIGAGLLALGAAVWLLECAVKDALDAGSYYGLEARSRTGASSVLLLGVGIGCAMAAGALFERGF